MVCLGNMYVDTLHKGEDDDDDDNNNNRQNKVAVYIYWTISKDMELQVTENYYKHIPEIVKTVNGSTIVWDVPVTTDRTILSRPTW